MHDRRATGGLLRSGSALSPQSPCEIRAIDQPGRTYRKIWTQLTGSGKSTLLDAICLALYGRTPRLENASPDEIVLSYGTGEASAEVEYEVGGSHYLSRWEVWRARKRPDGLLQAARMSLRKLDGTLEGQTTLASGKDETKAKNIELLGLELENFKRAVMLAQGEFGRFLQSNAAERSAILEKVTGTEVFTRIGKACWERTKSENDKLQQLMGRASELPLMTDEMRSEAEQSLERRQVEAKALEDEADRVKGLLDLVQSHETWGNAFADGKAALEGAQKAHEDAAERRSVLASFEAVTPLSADLRRWAESGEKLRSLQDRWEQLEGQLIPEDTKALEEACEAKATAKTALEDAERTMEEGHKPLCVKVRQLDGDADTKRTLLKDRRDLLKNLDLDIETLGKNREDLERQIEALEQQLQKGEAWLREHASDASLIESLSGLQERLNGLSNGLETVSDLQSQCLAAQKKLDGAKGETLKAHEAERLALSLAGKAAQALEASQARLAELTSGRSSAVLAEGLLAKNREIQSLKDRSRALEAFQKAFGSTRELQRKLASRNAELELARQGLSPLEERRRTQERLVEGLDGRLMAERAIRSLDQHRMDLKEGIPCPCCGALEHPWAKDLPAVEPDATELERNLASKELQKLEAALNKAKGTILQLEAEIANLQEDVEQKVKALAEKRAAFGNEAPEGDDLEDWIQEQLRFASTQTGGLEEEYRALEALKEEARKLEEQIRDQDLKQKELKEKASGATDKVRNQERDEEKLADALKALREQAAAAEDTHRKQQELCTAALAPYGVLSETLSTASGIQQLLGLLSRRSSDYRAKADEVNGTSQAIRDRKLKRDSVNEQLSNHGISRKESLGMIVGVEKDLDGLLEERRTLFGDLDPQRFLDMQEKAIKTLRETLKSAEGKVQHADQSLRKLNAETEENAHEREGLVRDLEQLTPSLNGRLQALGWAPLPGSEPELWALLGRTPADVSSRFDEMKVTRETLAQVDRDLNQAQGKLTSLERSKPAPLPEEPGLDPAALALRLEDAKGQVTAAHQDLGAIKQQLDSDDENRKKKAEIEARAGGQLQVCDQWRKLNELIGSANGDKFRNLAQGLNLRRLLVCANGHLQRYNDRYTLVSGTDLTDLDLQIQDGELAQTVRTIKNLSGGETFQISLALALGLSEMQGGTSGINTLLIDEGFGTLDAETLRRVMEALQSIKRDGKSVGIITHVRDIREHIPVGIHVERTVGGVGRVTMVTVSA